jgi:hypothetical protein
VILGVGEYSRHHQLSPAFNKARWLCDLSQEDLGHEIANVQNNG